MKILKWYSAVMSLLFVFAAGILIPIYYPDPMWDVNAKAIMIFTGGCILTCLVFLISAQDDEWARKIEREGK